MIEIPKEKNKAEDKPLKNVVLFGLPKIGKSSLVANDETLIISFEHNTSHVEGYIIDLSDRKDYKELLKDLKDLCDNLKNEDNFRYIAIDNLSSLMPLVKHIAEILYSNTIIGKNWFSDTKQKYGDVLNLPKGIGYDFLKQAYIKLMELFNSTGKTCIWLAHVKDKYMEETGLISMMEVDIPLSSARAFGKESEAIGYVYRSKDEQYKSVLNEKIEVTGDKVIISFVPAEKNVLCGSNVKWLSNKEFIGSELGKNGSVYSYLHILLNPENVNERNKLLVKKHKNI